MGYVIAGVLVLIFIAGFVTFLVLRATNKSGPVADGDEPPGIGSDETPLGDTREHAGEQSAHGVTASDPESGGRGGGPDEAAHVAHPGEGEGAERLEFEGEQPPDRLADRGA